MKIQSAKGTRDFYPQVMAVRNYILDGWKAASLRSGFEEYDGPIFEFLKMYQIKSGDEIASQLFSFTDRGGRDFAIRPEITPTLARMVNQQINALPRPIKWFSLPRLCRAERPQKGRLREFFQWNVDIIGVDDILADAEVIFTAIDYLRSAGLGPDDIVVKISSRKMLAAVLETIGIARDNLDAVYAVLDKKPRLPDDTFGKMIAEQITDSTMRSRVIELMSVEAIDRIGDIVALDAAAEAAVDELTRLFETLELMGVSDFVKFDIGIVRGLAYYTGVVYEIYDRQSSLRAICGGGRYDNLLKDFGGPSVPATGFGMGDAVLEILLREKGLLRDDMDELATRKIVCYVAIADAQFKEEAIQLATKLRLKGISADFSYKSASLKKQLKAAQAANAKYTIILGSELTENNQLVVKTMATGNQEEIGKEAFLEKMRKLMLSIKH